MTRPISLLSLVQARASLEESGFIEYATHHGIEIRPNEIHDLQTLTNELRAVGAADRVFDRYYVGYKIPQIGKEFDLLRFGKNYHVNLELKSDCDNDKMKRQLLRNRYYLSYLGTTLLCMCFSSLTRQFFQLSPSDDLIQISAEAVRDILRYQEVDESVPINVRFNPSAYLVSPFNSTERFLQRGYFLTSQQETFRQQILNLLAGSGSPRFIALTGAAGTGKTLLAYDIVAELIRSGRRPLIVHCGKLNEGHYALVSAGWTITGVKYLDRYDLSQFGPILLDEAQRIRPHQFTDLVAKINLYSGQCVFSFDRSQTLDDYETRNDVGSQIAAISGISTFSLSEKIRTNKEIADFIKSFVDNRRGLKVKDSGNIELVYFNNADDAARHLSSLDSARWKVIRFTPSQYKREHHETYSAAVPTTSHDVIGQEFDGVAVIVDHFFGYDTGGKLVYRGASYYQPAKMLFQNMTRARSRLRLIFINNPQMLNACMSIFSQPRTQTGF